MSGSRQPLYRLLGQKLRIAALGLVLVCVSNVAGADHGPETFASAHTSVVVVEPTWPGYTRPGFGAPPGSAPAGSGVYFGSDGASHYLITAAHVVKSFLLTERDRTPRSLLSIRHGMSRC